MSKCSSGQWTFPIPIQSCIAQQTTKFARGGARALPLPSPRFIVCWVPPPRHTHTGKHSRRAGIAQRGTAAVQPACTLKTRVRVLLCRQAEEDYEEEMRHLHHHTSWRCTLPYLRVLFTFSPLHSSVSNFSVCTLHSEDPAIYCFVCHRLLPLFPCPTSGGPPGHLCCVPCTSPIQSQSQPLPSTLAPWDVQNSSLDVCVLWRCGIV